MVLVLLRQACFTWHNVYKVLHAVAHVRILFLYEEEENSVFSLLTSDGALGSRR